MNLKHVCRMAVITGALLVLLAAGCTPRPITLLPVQTPAATAEPETAAPTEAPAPSPAAETPAPDMTLAPGPASYSIDGQTIVREQDGDSTVIYDASAHSPDGWDYRLELLNVEPEALYFTEGGEPKDGDYFEARYALVRLDFDGGGRMVLDLIEVVDYNQVLPHGSRIFFVVDGFDAMGIGWALRDGSGSAEIDFREYAARNGVSEFFNDATLYIEDGLLYADIHFFTEGEEDIVEHTVRIGDDLSVERVNG